MLYLICNKIIVSSRHHQSHPWQGKLRADETHSYPIELKPIVVISLGVSQICLGENQKKLIVQS